MPDLSHRACSEFWHQYSDHMIYRVITFMEAVEFWTLDGNPQVEEAINQLGKELDDLTNVSLEKLKKQDLFISIGNCIYSGRNLRLMQAVDTAQQGSASKLLIYAEENSRDPDDPPGLFLRRNIVFERLRLLGRVFSAQRFSFILKALAGDEYEEG